MVMWNDKNRSQLMRTDFVPSTLPSSPHGLSHLIGTMSLCGNMPAPGGRSPSSSPTPRPGPADGEITEPCSHTSLPLPQPQEPLPTATPAAETTAPAFPPDCLHPWKLWHSQ